MMQKTLALKKNEVKALNDLKEALSERFNLIDFRVFGSKARKEDTPESDIDVFIELDESNFDIESRIQHVVLDINLENDTFISTTIISKREIEEGPMSESPVYKAVMREGVSI